MYSMEDSLCECSRLFVQKHMSMFVSRSVNLSVCIVCTKKEHVLSGSALGDKAILISRHHAAASQVRVSFERLSQKDLQRAFL
ncbi:hypothetical protein STEG23_004505 [Scotinomys teguina]